MWKGRTKIVPVVIGALRTIRKRLEPSVAPRSPVSHRAAADHTNGHCTQRW